MKEIAVYANTCALGSYKELWPKAFYQGLQHHAPEWQSTYVTNRKLTNAEYAWCFAYQVKGDIKQSDTSHRRQIIDKYEPTGKIFFLDSDVLKIPHPEIIHRDFVLIPLLEITGYNFTMPKFGKLIQYV